MKKMSDFWSIQIENAEFQFHLFALQSKGQCFLSANTKLVGFDKAVQLSTKELAQSFCEAVMPTLRRRHGEAIVAFLTSCSATKVSLDDSLVKARIQQKVFAPNKRPHICA